jgi:hypothetical protein
MTDRITENAFAPSGERKSPETFCLTLNVLTALSEALSQLLDNGAYPNFFHIPTFFITDRYRMNN